MEYQDCIKKRLLRKEKADPEKSKRSLEIAERKLAEAKESMVHGIGSAAVILSYTSIFHAARALLFRDGYVEKSHACIATYLKEAYVNEGKLGQKYLRILKETRFERHEALYGLEIEIPAAEVEHAISAAKEFLAEIRKILEDD